MYPLKYPNIVTPSACASQCLNDTACTQFVWALPGESGTKCRLSHTCANPTGHLAGFDGYMRNLSRGGCGPQPLPPTALSFHEPLFTDGMILQRDAAAKVWGSGAAAGSQVHVSVKRDGDGLQLSAAYTTASATGNWSVSMPHVPASNSTTLTVTDGKHTVSLKDVAFGDVLLCGGQACSIGHPFAECCVLS